MPVGPRYLCLLEPCGTWTVWDTLARKPASLGGVALVGREEQRAQAACGVLNRIHKACPLPGQERFHF